MCTSCYTNFNSVTPTYLPPLLSHFSLLHLSYEKLLYLWSSHSYSKLDRWDNVFLQANISSEAREHGSLPWLPWRAHSGSRWFRTARESWELRTKLQANSLCGMLCPETTQTTHPTAFFDEDRRGLYYFQDTQRSPRQSCHRPLHL